MIQNMNAYTEKDQWVWKTLFERQQKNLTLRGCDEYNQCLEKMNTVLHADAVPSLQELSTWLFPRTGWQIEVVKGLIPVEEFFDLLSQKKFCSSTWLRSPDSLDYLEEPDMFHDIFGHVPLLADDIFSEFIYQFGLLGMKYAEHPAAVLALKRLYWFTIEFGLMKEKEIKVYGAGIISSFGETNTAVTTQVEHLPFDIGEILHKDFRTDIMQEAYYVIDSFQQLYDALPAAEKIIREMIKVEVEVSA